MLNSTLSNDTTTAHPGQHECGENRSFYWFLISSFVTFFVGISTVLLWRLFSYLCCSGRGRNANDGKSGLMKAGNPLKSAETEIGWVTETKDWAGELISGQSLTGRILVVFVFCLSIASLVIYFIDASHRAEVEICIKWADSRTQQVDLAFNVFFMIYFFIRFVAAPDKFWFLLEIYSFVDYFTIPPSFVAIYLDRNWLGNEQN